MKIPGPYSWISELEALRLESEDLQFRKLPRLVTYTKVWKPFFKIVTLKFLVYEYKMVEFPLYSWWELIMYNTDQNTKAY